MVLYCSTRIQKLTLWKHGKIFHRSVVIGKQAYRQLDKQINKQKDGQTNTYDCSDGLNQWASQWVRECVRGGQTGLKKSFAHEKNILVTSHLNKYDCFFVTYFVIIDPMGGTLKIMYALMHFLG